ncbi:MAG: ATP-binding protein [Chloroflexi bacterium]|nr:MAG: ATP-binding protein [Chloroflexota bacterium]
MHLILPNILGYEVIARDAVATLALRCGMPLERIEDVKTVLCEACTSTMEQGCHSDPQRKIQVVCDVDERQLVVEVYAEIGGSLVLPCKPVQWLLKQPISPRDSGLGLIMSLADEVSVSADSHNGTRMRLVFYRDPAEVGVNIS